MKDFLIVAGDQAWSDKRKGAFQLNMGTHFTSSRNLAFTGAVSKLFGHEHGYQGSISLQSHF